MTDRTDTIEALILHGQARGEDKKNSLMSDFTDVVADLLAKLDAGQIDQSTMRLITELLTKLDAGQIDQSTVSLIASDRQLEAGNSGGRQTNAELDDRSALERLVNSNDVYEGLQEALRRAFAPPSDSGKLSFDRNGNDTRIADLNKELVKVASDRDDLKQELDDERNDNKSNSLAGQLKSAKKENVELKQQLNNQQQPKAHNNSRQSSDKVDKQKDAAQQSHSDQGNPPKPGPIKRARDAFGGGQR